MGVKRSPISQYTSTCFLTTVTSGTDYRRKLRLFRVFRDKVLIGKLGVLGIFAVQFYYEASRFVEPMLKRSRIIKDIFLVIFVMPAVFFLENVLNARNR